MLNLSWFFRRGNRPPLDAAALAWIEHQLRWLRDEFGVDRLIDAPVFEPTPQYFPDAFDGSDESVRSMFERVCGYMDVSPDLVDLQLYSEANRPGFVNRSGHALPGSAGTYEESEVKFVIRLERSEIGRPSDLVGTLAHELSHLRLLGESRIDPDRFDNELLTDLTADFFGFGLFLANSPRHWHSQLSHWPGTALRRPEYMTLPMHCYALATIAELRFEEKPKWARHLNRAARSEFRAARRFLERRSAGAA